MLMFGNCIIPSYKYKSVFIVFQDVANNFISGDLIKLFQILLGLQIDQYRCDSTSLEYRGFVHNSWNRDNILKINLKAKTTCNDLDQNFKYQV